jgi:hypothetical protein
MPRRRTLLISAAAITALLLWWWLAPRCGDGSGGFRLGHVLLIGCEE